MSKLFIFQFSTPSKFFSSVNKYNPNELWHIRLGHLPFHKIKLHSLMNSGYIPDASNICNICPTARQHKLPFPHSYIKTTSLFQLIHIDTWGPYNTETSKGYKYFFNHG